MDVSKMRARMKMRKVAGQQVARQDRTSKAFAKAEAEAKNAPYAGESGIDVEGNKPRPRLDRPARASGGRVCRADGGVTLSEDTKKEVQRLRDDASKRMSASKTLDDAVKGVGTMAAGTVIHGMSRGRVGKTIGNLGMVGGPAGAALAMGNDMIKASAERAKANRLEKGLAEDGKEDRKRGGRVARDKDCD